MEVIVSKEGPNRVTDGLEFQSFPVTLRRIRNATSCHMCRNDIRQLRETVR